MIDLAKFNDFSWGTYDTDLYRGRCGYVKDEKMDGRVSVFVSGKMISTGAKTLSMSVEQLEHTMDLLSVNKLAKKVILKHKVENIVATLDLKSGLDVKTMLRSLDNYTYEPEIFPGIIYKHSSGISCLFFASGKIVIAGAKSKNNLKSIACEVERILKNNKTNYESFIGTL